MMKKSEIKAKVNTLLASGTMKARVFELLSNHGIKDHQLAHFIASYPDPKRCKKHHQKVNILIILMLIQTMIAFWLGFDLGAKIGPNAKWITGILMTSIPLLFAWGFHTNRVGAYNAYILLSIIQLPKAFEDFSSSPIASSIGISIAIGIIAFVWYVREQIFPNFALMTPKKIKGQYVFVG